jgi:hypothetical protein
VNRTNGQNTKFRNLTAAHRVEYQAPANWQPPQNECACCGEAFITTVPSPFEELPGRIFAGHFSRAERIAMGRRIAARSQKYSAPYYWHDRNDAEDNGPAHIGPEM